MIRRPPRSTLDRSSAASDVYKRQGVYVEEVDRGSKPIEAVGTNTVGFLGESMMGPVTVSYTHLRAHETVLDLVCRLLLEKKKTKNITIYLILHSIERNIS